LKPKIPIGVKDRRRYVLFRVEPGFQGDLSDLLRKARSRMYGVVCGSTIPFKVVFFDGSHGIIKCTNKSYNNVIFLLVASLPEAQGYLRILSVSGSLRKIREVLKGEGKNLI
jgi:RNase P/RNase MRP subunit POP5